MAWSGGGAHRIVRNSVEVKFFFPVPVCTITAPGVPGGTFVEVK
jgi:hypothetical protein